jgi:formylglycine-generating enzyme
MCAWIAARGGGLTKGYWLGETPVTQALWHAVMKSNPSQFVSDDRPVEQVSWDDCAMFLERLNRLLDGFEARLPTEAEWERACRAGTTTATWAGDLTLRGERDAPELDAITWYSGNRGVGFDLDSGDDSSRWEEKQHPHIRAGSHPVSRLQANPFGLHDMLGNVYEWCHGALYRYVSEPATDPLPPGPGSHQIRRGGSWRSLAQGVRAASRFQFDRSSRYSDLGFRLAGGEVSAPR